MVLVKKIAYITLFEKTCRSLLWITFCFTSFAFSQNEASNWYFGSGAGITFSTSPPTALTDGQMNALEGCATVSNFAGNLLFYTDGQTIWNRNHEEMLNGTGLFANASSAQAALIIPKPNSLGIYYVLTVDSGENEDGGIYYSEVEMALDGGMGAVTETKNVLLVSQTAEMITAYKSESFEGFWIVTHKMFTNQYYTFSIDEDGINTNPIISSTGDVFEDSVGQLKISTQGDKIAATLFDLGIGESSTKNINVSDFNAITGTVSNTVGLELGASNAYGLEFSPDGSKLYVCSGFSFFGTLAQFNLLEETEEDIQNSRFLIPNGSTRPLGSLQLGIDGKIYASAVSMSFLDVIDNPNALGIDCNYLENQIDLGGNEAQFGLPQFVQSLFSNKILHNTPCLNDEVNFSLFNANVDSVEWEFGDNTSGSDNTSTLIEPTHFYSELGTYEVKATVNVNGAEFEYTKEITVLSNPNVEPFIELIQCDDDLDGISTFNLSEANEIISNESESLIFTYYNSYEDAEANNIDNQINNLNNYSNLSALNDTVYARAETIRGCYSITEVSLIVVPNQIPQNFQLTYEACDDDLNDDNNLDGITTFDFSEATSVIQNLYLNDNISISYYTNEEDVLTEQNEIEDISAFKNSESPFSQTIWVRIDGDSNNSCIGYGQFITLNVITPSVAETNILEEYVICFDSDNNVINSDLNDLIIETGLNPNNYTFEWFQGSLNDVLNNQNDNLINNATESFFEPDAPGNYTVHAIEINTGCSIWDSTIVEASYPPENISIIQTSPFFSPRNSIIIDVLGTGNYEYKLDSGEWQLSNIFKNILAGEHIISVRDIYNCATIEKPFLIIGHPTFFTPNNDGDNDFWTIRSNDRLIVKEISIFDRYGKLLTILNNSESWDGTFNGLPLPTSDYWFKLLYYDNDELRENQYLGHFTLKR